MSEYRMNASGIRLRVVFDGPRWAQLAIVNLKEL